VSTHAQPGGSSSAPPRWVVRRSSAVHDSVPWVALDGQMEPIGGGEFRLTDRPKRLPHTYTLQARKL